MNPPPTFFFVLVRFVDGWVKVAGDLHKVRRSVHALLPQADSTVEGEDEHEREGRTADRAAARLLQGHEQQGLCLRRGGCSGGAAAVLQRLLGRWHSPPWCAGDACARRHGRGRNSRSSTSARWTQVAMKAATKRQSLPCCRRSRQSSLRPLIRFRRPGSRRRRGRRCAGWSPGRSPTSLR